MRPVPAVEHLGRTDGMGSRPIAVGVLVATVLFVLVTKPWGSPTPPPSNDLAERPTDPASSSSAGRIPTSAPGQVSAPGGVDAHGSEQCEYSGGWRVFVAEAHDPLTVHAPTRRWLAIEPLASASSPADPAIPFVLVAERTMALGYCAPSAAGGGPPARVGVTAWALAPDGAATRLPLVDVATRPETSDPLEGLFAPAPRDPTDVSPAPEVGLAWPEGRYVLLLSDGSRYARWFGVELRYPRSPTGPTPTPSTAVVGGGFGTPIAGLPH